MPGRLVLAATPLGNPGDASERLRQALAEFDVVAAEDTRRLRHLAVSLGVEPRGRVVSFHDAVERERLPRLIDAIEQGQQVLVVSDAGMPSISDPGYRLVVAAAERGLAVTVLPGPSAVTTALALSGLPVDRFCFEGFLPRRAGERGQRLMALAGEQRTMVFFEAPHRAPAMLDALRVAFGDGRRAAACRELTKAHEEVVRGTLGDLVAWAGEGIRGELTLVVEGAPRAAADLTDGDLAGRVMALVDAGLTRKDAIGEVARETGLPKRRVFDAVVAGKPAR